MTADQGQVATPAPEGDPPGSSEEPSTGLGRAAAHGAAWLTAQKWIVRLSGLATIAVLARMVTPEEFGVVAVASAVIPFVLLLSDLGLSTYLVQADDPDERMLSTGFWFSLVAAFVDRRGAVRVRAARGGRRLTRPRPAPSCASCSPPCRSSSVAAVPTALLRRRMAFRRLAIQGTAAAALAQVVAVVIALAGGGVWALVAQAITTTLVTTTAAWLAAGWRPTLSFSRSEFGTMARFGYKVVGVELVAVLRNWAETAIIAVVAGHGRARVPDHRAASRAGGPGAGRLRGRSGVRGRAGPGARHARPAPGTRTGVRPR